MMIIAESTSSIDWIEIINLIFTGALAFVVFGLKRNASKQDALQGKLDTREETIQKQIEDAVDQKIGALGLSIQRLDDALSKSNININSLFKGAHQSELDLANQVHGLKEWIMTHLATQDSVETLNRKIDAFQQDLIRVQEQVSALQSGGKQ